MESLNAAVPLSEVEAGRRVLVKKVAGGRGIVARMAAMGVVPGAELEVVRNPGHGPLIVRVKGSFLALGRGEAVKVMVQEVDNAGMPRSP